MKYLEDTHKEAVGAAVVCRIEPPDSVPRCPGGNQAAESCSGGSAAYRRGCKCSYPTRKSRGAAEQLRAPQGRAAGAAIEAGAAEQPQVLLGRAAVAAGEAGAAEQLRASRGRAA